MTITEFLKVVILGGITIGAPYAACAVGMQLFYLPTRAVNFAQGELMVLGATLFVLVLSWLPEVDPIWLILPTAAAAYPIAIIFGWLLLKIVRHYGPLRTTLVLVGVSMLVKAVSSGLGNEANYAIRSSFCEESTYLCDLSVKGAGTEVLAVLLTFVLLFLLGLYVHRHRLTDTLDGFGANPRAFALWEQGPSIARVGVKLCLFVGVASGVLLAPTNYADPYVGLKFGVHGFGIIVFAGRRFWLAVLLGIVWGIGEQLVAWGIGDQLVGGYIDARVIREIILLFVIFLAVLWKYGGLSWRSMLRRFTPLSMRKFLEICRTDEYENPEQH